MFKKGEKMKKLLEKFKLDGFWKNLLKNSLWAFLGESIASFIGLIITIILIKKLGSDKYGILVLAQSYMLIMDAVINVQSWKSVIQFGQKSLVKKDYKNLNSYIKLGTILDMSTAVLCCIISFFFPLFLGSIFSWSNEMILCCEIFSITIISHFSGTPTAILRIYDKFHLVALQKFISAIIKLFSLFIVLFYFNETSLILITIIYCITDVIGNLLLVIFAILVLKRKTQIKTIIKSKLPDDRQKFISFTLWGTLSEIVDVPVNYFDMFIVSLLGTDYVAVFKVFKQIVAILQKITSPLQQAIMPQFSELKAQMNETKGYEIVIKIQKISFYMILPISLIIGLTSPIWLKIIYNDIYAGKWYILLLYLLTQSVALSYTTIHPYFLSLNEPKRSFIYVLIANIVFIISSYILVFPLGMLGIVISYTIQYSIVICLKLNYIKTKVLKLKS